MKIVLILLQNINQEDLKLKLIYLQNTYSFNITEQMELKLQQEKNNGGSDSVLEYQASIHEQLSLLLLFFIT